MFRHLCFTCNLKIKLTLYNITKKRVNLLLLLISFSLRTLKKNLDFFFHGGQSRMVKQKLEGICLHYKYIDGIRAIDKLFLVKRKCLIKIINYI